MCKVCILYIVCVRWLLDLMRDVVVWWWVFCVFCVCVFWFGLFFGFDWGCVEIGYGWLGMVRLLVDIIGMWVFCSKSRGWLY